MTAQNDDETGHGMPGQMHPKTEQVIIKGRKVWVERDAAGSIVAVSESRQVLVDTDDDYASIARHHQSREHDRQSGENSVRRSQ